MKTKKQKVEIPEGHELDRLFTNHTTSGGITTTVVFKPIAKYFLEYFNMIKTYYAGDIVFFHENRYIFDPDKYSPQESIGVFPRKGYGWRIDKKELPKTWEEYIDTEKNTANRRTSLYVHNKYYDAFMALNKLIELRDVYNDGQTIQRKCGLTKDDETKEIIMTFNQRDPLEFNNTEIANEFLKTFYSLLEIAKPLL